MGAVVLGEGQLLLDEAGDSLLHHGRRYAGLPDPHRDAGVDDLRQQVDAQPLGYFGATDDQVSGEAGKTGPLAILLSLLPWLFLLLDRYRGVMRQRSAT